MSTDGADSTCFVALRSFTFRLLKNLFDYTNYHFSAEEALFFKFSYPETDNHKARHQQFTAYVREQFESFKSGQRNSLDDVVAYLASWITDHIRTDTRRTGKTE